METWIVHHANATIHRCAANTPALPSHLDEVDLCNAEIFTRIAAREQYHLACIYSNYVSCEECEAVLCDARSTVISQLYVAVRAAVRNATRRCCSTL